MSWLTAIFSAIAAFLEWLKERARESARAQDRLDGAREAAQETEKVIGEIADEQTRINSRRDDAGAVAQQLRDEADAIERSRR